MSAPRAPSSSHRDGVVIDVRVQPRAANTEIEGVSEGVLRVRVTAPPVGGAANAAVVELLAKHLQVPKARVQIIGGASSRNKRILVPGLSPEEVWSRLGLT